MATALMAYAGDRRTTIRTKLFDLEPGEARVIANRGVHRLRALGDGIRRYSIEGAPGGVLEGEAAVDFLAA